MNSLQFREGKPHFRDFVWSERVESKILAKHTLTRYEVEEAFRTGTKASYRKGGGSELIQGRTRSGKAVEIAFKSKGGFIWIRTAYPV